DFGCGAGLLACEAAKLGAFAHAIDISEPMLRTAKRRAAEQGLGAIAFHPVGILVLRSRIGVARFCDNSVCAPSFARFLEGRRAVAHPTRSQARRQALSSRRGFLL